MQNRGRRYLKLGYLKLAANIFVWGVVSALPAAKSWAQQVGEAAAPGVMVSPTPEPSPIANQCYLVQFDKIGSAYSQKGALSFSEAFKGPESGCLAEKIASIKPMFLFRQRPDPSELSGDDRATWQQGCEANCDFLQYASTVPIPDITEWKKWGQCEGMTEDACKKNLENYNKGLQNWKDQFPLLSASEYIDPTSPACQGQRCFDPLVACKVRCGQNLPRQCYWQSWCKTPAGEQRRFCGTEITANLCADLVYADDTAVEKFMELFFGTGNWPSGDTDQVTCSDAIPAVMSDAWKNDNCQGLTTANCEQKYAVTYAHTLGRCVTGSFALDGQCKLLTRGQAKNCANVAAIHWLASSPISLIWTSGLSIREKASIVNFKLDYSSTDTWYRWYGSADAPLLVYDPTHSGRIESAHQLFGNWTFGGKRVASLDLGTHGAMPWKNGYEALKTLDRNGDDLIKGEELEPLGLWFDTNRDAHAQENEVRDIRLAGVLSLSVGPQRRDALTGDVSVVKGFEKVVDGSVEVGESVDWFSDGAPTMRQLVLTDQMSYSAHKEISTTSEGIKLERPNREGIASRLPEITNVSHDYAEDSKIAGIWLWGSKDETDLSSHQGVIAIRERKSGQLEVMTVGELGVHDTTGVTRALQKFYLMTGSVAKTADGSVKLSFKNPLNTDSETTAILDEAQGILRGETIQRSAQIKGTKTIQYSWQAKRALQK